MKVPIDISLEDVSKVFGPIINKNGYNYTYLNDPPIYRENKAALDDHTPEALPSCVAMDFLRDDNRISC